MFNTSGWKMFFVDGFMYHVILSHISHTSNKPYAKHGADIFNYRTFCDVVRANDGKCFSIMKHMQHMHNDFSCI